MHLAARAILSIGAVIVMGGQILAGEAALALSEDECRAVWNTAAGRSDLSVDGAKPYIDTFEAVDTNHDSKISNAEFKAACAAGLVHKFRPQN
jgi:hypothetical protein